VIEDIEGATLEPTRRPHVFALSAAVAAVTLALLVVLLVPPSRHAAAPQAASAAPSASSGPVMTIVSGPTVSFVSGSPYAQAGPLPLGRVDERSVRCVGGVSNPPYIVVFDGNGQVVAAYSSGRSERSVPTLPDAYVGSVGTGWLTVPCATSDLPALRIDRAR
jgi:hypothetical protein